MSKTFLTNVVHFRERAPVGNRPVKGSNADEDGIYDNKRFTHACTTLVGAPVTVNEFPDLE